MVKLRPRLLQQPAEDIMNRYALALTATSALIAALTTPAEAQIFGRRGNAETTQVINEAPRCT